MPRWLLLDDARVMGGGQQVALRAARYLLSARGDDAIRIGCPAGTELARECRAEGVPWVDVPFPDPSPAHALSWLRAGRQLRGLLAEDDLVVADSARTQGVMALAVRRLTPRPPTVNLMIERDSAERPTARWVYRRFGAMVVLGSEPAAVYADRLPGVEVAAVNNFLLGDEVARLAAARLGHEPGPPKLGVLGRLIPEKGVLELVEELASSPSVWSELVVAGARQDETYATRIEDRARAEGLAERVKLVGPVEDVAAFLSGLDRLVVPSTGNEGQPTVILEALAAGTAVLARAGIDASDFAGLPLELYATADELAAALAGPPPAPAPEDELRRRFGPEQFVEGIEAAAGSSPRAGS